MKKMFILLVSLVTFSALFAQYEKPYDNRRGDDRNTPVNDRSYNNQSDGYGNHDQHWNNNNGGYQNGDRRADNQDPNYRPDRAVDMRRGDNNWRGDNRMSDGDRRAGMDRINRDYDHQEDVYRNDRNMDGYERDRRIDRLQRERNERLRLYGGGIILGGLAGVIIGSQL